jgi:uncharacterized protein YciI
MEFLVIAYDGTDKDALQRRLAARKAHLADATKLKAQGKLIEGGAILNDEGQMIGSTLYMKFDNRDELQEWIDNDPYTKGNVWEKVEVRPIKLVQF